MSLMFRCCVLVCGVASFCSSGIWQHEGVCGDTRLKGTQEKSGQENLKRTCRGGGGEGKLFATDDGNDASSTPFLILPCSCCGANRLQTQMLQEVVSRGEQPARDFCELRWRDDGDAGR